MLTNRQITIVLTTGIVFWVLFAVTIRATPVLFDAGLWNALLFIVTVPLAWVLVSLLKRLAALDNDQLVPGIALAFAIAFLMDGVVFTWFDWIYGDTAQHVRAAAGFILWGAGVTIILAFVRWHTGRG